MKYDFVTIGNRLWLVPLVSDDRIVFHFNKKHNEDANIPPWIVKVAGETFYCDSVTASVPFSTKNTPKNNATKGSLMFHGRVRFARTRYLTDVPDCVSAYDAEIN